MICAATGHRLSRLDEFQIYSGRRALSQAEPCRAILDEIEELGIGGAAFFAPAPSGSGYQVSLFGLAGALASVEEGLEVHLLGLTFGVDPLDLAVKVPGLGRLPSLARTDSLVADARP